ncbi:unnamed protein product [Acanthoscelides obtectus]|uniref:Uncharacterized protein n=1 Tax=Acanthoscelides obtectus TaxID=200917 RepID=A0A9P0KEX1_ACAOB|nr:unnamed protein product [Acanthoscelides obtectus]CAK1680119.1 hypothetical protein AOBTE_LOCUS32513 [Acanthoscelides obtectus]
MQILVVLLVATVCALGHARLQFSKVKYPQDSLDVQGYSISADAQVEAGYNIPNDQVVSYFLRTIFVSLGGSEPRYLVELINTKVLRQIQHHPRSVTPVLRDVYIELKRCVYGLQLPVGFKRAFLHNIYKYFELLPQLKLGGPRSEEELYCQTKIIVTLIEACKGVPLEPKSIRILLDATVLLIRLVSGPLEELPPPVHESQTEVNITIDVEVQQNVELAPPLDNEYKFFEITQESYEYGPGPEEYVAPEEPQEYEQPQFEISMEANMTFEELSYEEQFPEPVVEPSPVPVPERFQEKHELRLEFEQKYESESGLLPRQDYPGDRPGYTNISFELEEDESYPPENTHLPLVVEEEEIEANISITYENNLVPYIEQPVYQTVNEDLTVNITIERESVELVEPSTELAVPEMPDVVESYYSEISIDWDLYYGNNPDDNTPSYIPTPEPVLNAVSPLKETLETLVGGNQPLTLLPEVVETAKIVNRIKIDIKISIERIVGTLIGYRPGLCEVVRQVYSLTASLLHTTVPQNNPRTIDILVKVILSSLRNAQPSILRVIEGVLSKLFSKILMPSTSPLDEILKQVIPLIKQLESIWDKLPHRPRLTPQKLIPYIHSVIKMVHQVKVSEQRLPRLLAGHQNSIFEKIVRKIYSSVTNNGDCTNREIVQLRHDIHNLKLDFPDAQLSVLKEVVEQLHVLDSSLKASCSNSLIHRYVKDFEYSLFKYWGIEKQPDMTDLFVQPIVKSALFHDLDKNLWGNIEDLLAALTGTSNAPVSPEKLAKISMFIKRFYRRTIINTPNNYEINNIGLRLASLITGAFSIPHVVVNQFRSTIVKGLILVRDVHHGKREVQNVVLSVNSIIADISKVLQNSPVLQAPTHPLVSKIKITIVKSIVRYATEIQEYRNTVCRYVEELKKQQRVAEISLEQLEVLLYRLPPIVKEMTKCSEILPYNSHTYLQRLLITLAGRDVPVDLSYRLINMVRQLRNQRCENDVPLPESLARIETSLSGKVYKKRQLKIAIRKIFTQVAFANSVNSRLNKHLLYTIQHLLGVLQPHVITDDVTAGSLVSAVRDWVSGLIQAVNQPRNIDQLRHIVARMCLMFTNVLRPHQREPLPELNSRFFVLSKAIVRWFQESSPRPLGEYTREIISGIVQVLKPLNNNVDESHLSAVLNIMVIHLQGYAVNKDDTLNNPSVYLTNWLLELLGKEVVPNQKQQIIYRTKIVLATLRNQCSCVTRRPTVKIQPLTQDYIKFLQQILLKLALTVESTVMKPSVQSLPAPYEYLRPGYVDTCSNRAPSVWVPAGEHSLSQLWDLNLITALDNVKKGILLFLDDYSGLDLTRNIKEVLDTSLSAISNDAISHSERLSFSIKLVLRINNGVVVPGNSDTLKKVREIVDLSDLLSGIRISGVYHREPQRVSLIIKKLLIKISGLYGCAPSSQFTQTFQQLILYVLRTRTAPEISVLHRHIVQVSQAAHIHWGHVVIPAKRVSLDIGLRNLLVNVVRRIVVQEIQVNTWEPCFEQLKPLVRAISTKANPNTLVELLKQVVAPVHSSFQCSSISQTSVSRSVASLLHVLGGSSYQVDVRQYLAFDYLVNNVREIACMKNRPQNKPDYIVNDFGRYLQRMGLPQDIARTHLHRLFSVMIENLHSNTDVFLSNVRPVIPALVQGIFKSLRVTVQQVESQRLTKLYENLLVSIKHKVFQERQVQTIVKIVSSLVRHPNNDHLHYGLSIAFYHLTRSITEDNGYTKHPRVVQFLQNVRVALTIFAVNRVSLKPSRILIGSRMPPEQYPTLNTALFILARSLQAHQPHQSDGPLFDALLQVIRETKTTSVPSELILPLHQIKKETVDFQAQLIRTHVSSTLHHSVMMKTVGVIDEFINKLETHFGNILPKPVREAPLTDGVPEMDISELASTDDLFAEFKGPVGLSSARSSANIEAVLFVDSSCLSNPECEALLNYWRNTKNQYSGIRQAYVVCDEQPQTCVRARISVQGQPQLVTYLGDGRQRAEKERRYVQSIAELKSSLLEISDVY